MNKFKKRKLTFVDCLIQKITLTFLRTFALLPDTDDNGSPILLMRGGLEEPGKYKIEDLFKV